MYPLIAISLTVIVGLVTLSDWRKGLYLMICIAVLQDPFRKLTPGIPSYYVMWSGAVFAMAFFSAWSHRNIPQLRYLALGDSTLRRYGRWMAAIVILQALHSLVRWGNPIIPALGMIIVVAPVAGVLVGMAFAKNAKYIERFMQVYVVIVGPIALTVYLSSEYQDAYPVLREIGTFAGVALRIYDVGTVLESYSGLFRVGEIAAWHAGTTAIFLLILALRNPAFAFRVIVAGLIVLLIGAILMTGRRKMLMVLTIFLVVFAGGLVILRRGVGKAIIAAMALGVLGSYGLGAITPDSETSLYLERGTSVFSSVGDRAEEAFVLFNSAVQRSSGIGLGLGSTAQGAHLFGTKVSGAGGAGEAGIGKIVLEFGLPGLVLLVLLLFRLAKRSFSLTMSLAKARDPNAYFSVAFGAFLISNLAAFSVASQLFGDPFILIIIGMTIGFMLRVLAEGFIRLTETQNNRRAANANTEQPLGAATI